MKALVYTAPHEMTIMQQPDPVAGENEVVVKIDAVGICGSDMHAYQGHDARRLPPLVLGHEICGTVTSDKHKGRRVILNPLISCNRCYYCETGRPNICSDRTMIGMTRPGGYADAVSIPEQCLVFVADDMDPVAAALTEPAATGLHGLVLATRVMARPIAEARTLVIGAGSVGLLTALLLKHQGCEHIHIAETNELRQGPARAAGFSQVFNPIETLVDESSFDLVIDCVGSQKTREMSMFAAAPGSVFLHIGLMDNNGGLDARKMTLAEIIMIGAYTYTQADLGVAAQKLYSGAYGSLDWVETRHLDEGPETFSALLRGEIAAPKVVLTP
jgi:threonine dehydrogenase-like Zn-dependent dehydrogenase